MEADAIAADVWAAYGGSGRDLARSNFRGLRGSVGVDFTTSSSAQAAAAEAHGRWGDRLCITVGGRPYPPDAWPDRVECPSLDPPSGPSGLTSAFTRDDPTPIESGDGGIGTLVVTNAGPGEVVAGGGPEYGLVVTPGTRQVVGHVTGLAQTGMLEEHRFAPGERREYRVGFATSSCRPGTPYGLEAGTYGLIVPFASTDWQMYSPEVPITVR